MPWDDLTTEEQQIYLTSTTQCGLTEELAISMYNTKNA